MNVWKIAASVLFAASTSMATAAVKIDPLASVPFESELATLEF